MLKLKFINKKKVYISKSNYNDLFILFFRLLLYKNLWLNLIGYVFYMDYSKFYYINNFI